MSYPGQSLVGRSLIPLQRHSRCILQPQSTGLRSVLSVTTNIVSVFVNGPGDLGSILGRVIPKTPKMVLEASLDNTQHYKVRIKGKVEQSKERRALSPTSWCSSYRKGSLRVTLDYGPQLYFTIFNIDYTYYLID